jgi:hypothetical protein
MTKVEKSLVKTDKGKEFFKQAAQYLSDVIVPKIKSDAEKQDASLWYQQLSTFKKKLKDYYEPEIKRLSEPIDDVKKEYKQILGKVMPVIEQLSLAIATFAQTQELKAQKVNEKRLEKAEENSISPLAVPMKEVSKMDGAYTVDTYSAELVDDRLIPAEYYIVDVDRIQREARTLKEKFNVPGYKLVVTKSVRSKGR